MNRLFSSIRHSSFFRTFHLGDDRSRGRCVMLAHSILNATISYLTGGVFYTGFLVANDIDIVNLGIINFLPLLANCLSIFAPLILERFQKRRYLLVGSRLLYFTILILGVTVLPSLVADKAAKVFWFGVIVFSANAVSALTAGGFSVWHLNFIPDSIRAEFFSHQQVISTAISSTTLLVSSLVADALAGTPNQLQVLYILRFIAYGLVLVEAVVLLLPKEYPYPQKVTKLRLSNVFSLAWNCKPFLYTMFVVAAWTLNFYFTSSAMTFYLLETIGTGYSFINFIDASYALFLIALSPFWRRFIRRRGWIYTFAVTAMMHCPTMVLYAFITPGNYTWLMTTVRISQHIMGVGLNLAYANLPFLNLPKEDQSNYLVFHTLVTNLCAFVGSVFSTWFISLMEGLSLNVGFHTFAHVPLLILLQGTGYLIIGFVVYKTRKRIAPKDGLLESAE